MMKLGIFMSVIVILLSCLVSANLGTYEIGDTVYFTVVCVTDDGSRDAGCSGSDTRIYAPGEFVNRTPSYGMAEVNETEAPGLWYGNYTVEVATIGSWTIYGSLTNSNGTIGATSWQFQVVTADTDTIYSDLSANASSNKGRFDAIDGNATDNNISVSGLVRDINSSITTYGDTHWDLTLAQNDTIYGTADNVSILNATITSYGDQQWITGLTTAQDASLSAIENNVSDSTYGLNATNDYLINTIFNYLVNHIQAFLNVTFYEDMGRNFTSVSGRFDAMDGNATDNNISVSGLVRDVNSSITSYGDQQWVTAFTTAQNDTLYSIDGNTSVLNSTITSYGDQQWASAFTTAQNDTLYSIDGNTSILNATITSYGDQQWVGRLTASQNDTLYSIDGNTSILNATITSYGDQQWITGLTTAQNDSLNAIEANVSDSTYGLNATNDYLINTIFNYLVNHIQAFLNVTFYVDMGRNFTSVSGRFDAMDGNATDNNISVSGLVRDVNSSITSYGDQQWVTAFTTAQNDSLNAIETNVSDSNFGQNATMNYLINTVYSNITGTMVNYSLIANATDVWTYGWRTVHGFEA